MHTLIALLALAEAGARPYRALSVGNFHACALGRDGVVFCGGYNAFGQVGDGSTVSRSIPKAVFGSNNQVYVAAGTSHACSVNASGGVSCWGRNNLGQLGDGTFTNRTAPVTVRVASMAPLSGIAEVSAGNSHTCARTYSGSMYCWGHGLYGQLATT